jgi:hypothetical protein
MSVFFVFLGKNAKVSSPPGVNRLVGHMLNSIPTTGEHELFFWNGAASAVHDMNPVDIRSSCDFDFNAGANHMSPAFNLHNARNRHENHTKKVRTIQARNSYE